MDLAVALIVSSTILVGTGLYIQRIRARRRGL